MSLNSDRGMAALGEATAMAARKSRLVRSREPNGRIQREDAPAASQIRRLRDAALLGMADPEWGTELGRLFLQETITPTMYAAGKRWAEVASKYQRAIGIFPLRSMGGEPISRTTPPDPDSDDGQKIAKRDAENTERFFEAHAILVLAGAEGIVRRLCEQNEALIGVQELNTVRRGLMHLVTHWRLGN